MTNTLSIRETITARKLLSKYGRVVTATRDNPTSSDPTTGDVDDTAPTTTYQGFGYPSVYKMTQIDGDLIRASDTRLVLATIAIPQINDVINILGINYTALNVTTITVQNSNVLYIVQCRV